MARTVKKNVRFDSHHIRLRTGETEKKNGYEYRWTTPDGKRHSTFAPTLDKLREIEEELAADKHDGIKTDVKGLTVNDCYELWKELKRGIKDSTYKNYIYMYEMFVKPTFGQKKVTKVLKSDVKRFYNTLADDKHLKVSTIDNIHNVLHQVFQVAVDDNYIRGNPTDRMLKELKVAHGHEIEKRKALSMAQQELFINYIKETEKYQHWYPVFYIMLNTGMRVGELTGLRWRDVDFENGMISVNHTLVYYNHQDELGTYYSINTPKTDAGKREIPIVEGVREAFEMERKYQEENGIVSKSRIDGYEDFIVKGRNPLVVLNIEMDPQLLDVNVHPSKWEVRISKENQLEYLIKDNIREALKSTILAPAAEVKVAVQKVAVEPIVFDTNSALVTPFVAKKEVTVTPVVETKPIETIKEESEVNNG